MRILVIRRDNIGDLVCTTPLFAALRQRYPDAHIAALVNSYNAAVLEANPDVDEVHRYTKLKHRRPGESRLRIVLERLRMLARLRREPFDCLILAKAGFDRHGLNLARQLRARQVVGFAPPGRAAPRSITLPVAPLAFEETHEVRALQRLAAAAGAPDAEGPLKVQAPPERTRAWREAHPALAHAARWVAVHVSAREASRRWPAANWTALLEGLLAEPETGVLLLWAPGPADDPRHPGDDAMAREIAGRLGPRSRLIAAPTAELGELIAALSCAHAFIGVDGGAMHLAAGLQLPVVALFENLRAKTERWFPWKVAYEMVKPATREVADISVPQVLDAWSRLRPRVRQAR